MKLVAVILSLSFLNGLCFPLFSALGAESHPGISVESSYSEASLAYNQQYPDKALEILTHVLDQDPNYIPALELKALILKTRGKDLPALETYLKIISMKEPHDRGPYYFESAILLNRLGKNPEAITYFDAAIKLNFNVIAAHLFLGMIEFNSGSVKRAKGHFREVENANLAEMQVVAHYYLGLIYLKEGNPITGSDELKEAISIAKSVPDNKTATEPATASQGVLDSFKKGQWFANVSALYQYDSNISEVPNDAGVQAQASNTGTSQAVFSGGAGYMSPLDRPLQFIPSYQFSLNLNSNSQVKEYEYFSNVGSVFINYKTLERFSFGAKLQGTLTFQNMPEDANDTNGSYKFTKYDLSGDLGPYFKFQATPDIKIEGDLSDRPQLFYSQPGLSGNGWVSHLSIKKETSSPWLNPSFGMSYEIDSTTSSSYKDHVWGASLGNTMKPTAKDTVILAMDFTYYNYYDALPVREDTTYNPHLNFAHSFTDKWSLIGELSYTKNVSTQSSSYSYHRFVLGTGVSYSF